MNLIGWADYAQDRWRRGAGPGEPGQMSLPVDKVFLHHTVTNVTEDPIADATTVNDVDQGRFGKVSYSWLVHEPSRSWIECEGLHRGAHTIDNAGHSLNYVAFGVGVIGNYQNDVPGVPTLKPSSTLLSLIADGIREYVLPHVQKDWTLLGHRDVYATACCGDLLYPHLGAIRTLIDNPSAPAPEDDMATLIRTPSDGKVWCLSAAGRWHVKDAAQELPLVEWNIIKGTSVTSLTAEQEPGFLLIPEIA